MRVLRRNKNATLSGHALGVGLAERNASTSKISSTTVISLQRLFRSISLSARHQPSCSLIPPLPSEPLSCRFANPRAKGPRSSDSSSPGPASIRADTDGFVDDISTFDYSRSEDYPLLVPAKDQQQCNDFFNDFLNNVFTSATAQGRLPPPLPNIGFPISDSSDPYLTYPFQVSPGIDIIISSLVADPLMDQTLYAQTMNGDFLNGGLEAKLDSVMVSGPSETELQYYRTFLCQRTSPRNSRSTQWKRSIVMLFFSSFVNQMPVVHPHTWTPNRTSPLLVGAMQACGALYVKTRLANSFITSTLAQARDPLVAQFVRADGFIAGI